jgi:carboxylesterase
MPSLAPEYWGNPFPGLRPFEEEDADLFLGRETQVRELRARMADERFMAVVGLSGSAVIVAWLAQFRADVDKAIVIAPVFGLLPNWPIFGTRSNHAVAGLLDLLPNIMTQSIMPFKEGPAHGYLGFATHGLSHTMDLGAVVFKAAQTTLPAARRVLMVMNDADPAVNNAMIRDLTARWKKTAPDRVDFYDFPASMGLIHDIIDPQQKQQKTDLVYPILLDLFTK